MEQKQYRTEVIPIAYGIILGKMWMAYELIPKLKLGQTFLRPEVEKTLMRSGKVGGTDLTLTELVEKSFELGVKMETFSREKGESEAIYSLTEKGVLKAMQLLYREPPTQRLERIQLNTN